jgi:hypothetical protein
MLTWPTFMARGVMHACMLTLRLSLGSALTPLYPPSRPPGHLLARNMLHRLPLPAALPSTLPTCVQQLSPYCNVLGSLLCSIMAGCHSEDALDVDAVASEWLAHGRCHGYLIT